MTWLPWVFWVVAIVASVLYGAFAITIFVKVKGPPPSRPWFWHQRWLNFLGSIVGWLSSWLIILRHCGWPITSCEGPPDAWDLIGGLIAFLGMTGYLPFTLLGLAAGLRAVGEKGSDLVAKYLPKV